MDEVFDSRKNAVEKGVALVINENLDRGSNDFEQYESYSHSEVSDRWSMRPVSACRVG